MGTIGKKKGKKEKNSMLPLLLAGGLAAYYFYTQSNDSGTAPDTNQAANNPAPPADSAPAQPQYSNLDFTPVLLPTDTIIYNSLYSFYTPWRYAIDRMTAQERKDLYQYVYGYMQKGYHLYKYPGIYPDGHYDPDFYNTILALSDKWSLQLLF